MWQECASDHIAKLLSFFPQQRAPVLWVTTLTSRGSPPGDDRARATRARGPPPAAAPAAAPAATPATAPAAANLLEMVHARRTLLLAASAAPSDRRRLGRRFRSGGVGSACGSGSLRVKKHTTPNVTPGPGRPPSPSLRKAVTNNRTTVRASAATHYITFSPPRKVYLPWRKGGRYASLSGFDADTAFFPALTHVERAASATFRDSPASPFGRRLAVRARAGQRSGRGGARADRS